MRSRTLGSIGVILLAVLFPSGVFAQTSLYLNVTDASSTPVVRPSENIPPPPPVKGERFIFGRNLQKGDNSQDVAYLQKLLNLDPDTQVSASGVGSSGHETTYFGELTKQAVIRFQNKYAVVVLKPYGLSVGTGFVGAATRGMLNKL